MRLIDADELKTAFPTCDNSKPVLVASVRATINHMPTIEQQPMRKRGHWKETDDGWDGTYYVCSICGCPWTLIDGTPEDNGMNYCPNCGADLREGGEDA